MRTNQTPTTGARNQTKTFKDRIGQGGKTAAPGEASRLLGLNAHERRKAEVLALSGALLTLTARSSTGVTASALATACLIVTLAAAVVWSFLGRVVPDVPPAAPYLEATTPGGSPGGPPNARRSDLLADDAQPESTASVPLPPLQPPLDKPATAEPDVSAQDSEVERVEPGPATGLP